MTALERHCRLLLRTYPAEYRTERGEEIIGTLLEATPSGRSWPVARDIRSLVLGGLHARAEWNRRTTTAANLRVAVIVGVSAYLAFTGANNLAYAVGAFVRTPAPTATPIDVPLLTTGAVVLVAVATAWLCRRKTLVLAVPAAAALSVVLAAIWAHTMYISLVPDLLCLAMLALLASRGERPGRRWLWPVALAGWPLAYLLPGFWLLTTTPLMSIEAVALLSLPWVVIDARPAVATAVFAFALYLPAGVEDLQFGNVAGASPVLITCAVAAVAVWQLRRQSARVTGDRQS